jgi:hypothetical protein
VNWVGFAWAQSGNTQSFEFLNMPAHARLAALGGINVSWAGSDINFIFNNPALAADTLAGLASAGYLFYLADIGQATFSYAHGFDKVGTLTFGVRHVNYGELVGYDASGAETGVFTAGDTEVLLGKSHQVGAFRLGVNVKGVFSNIAGFRGSALLTDIGGVYIHPHKLVTAGLVIRNLGFMLKEYSETNTTPLPFDVQVGTTFKPEHMPVRFSLSAYNLARLGKTGNAMAGDAADPSTLNKMFRHINVGMEVLIHKHVTALVGYNGQRQQELKDATGAGMRGITFGFSVRVNQVECVVSRASYSAGYAAYAFTLMVNTKTMLMKRNER